MGDDVVAIGNPLGELTFSLTKGAVSALNRNITIENQSMTLIQTDCAINSGNSGGALFNTHGEVIGITNAKYSSSGRSSASVDNIGFAIPMNSVRDIITSIIDKGYFDRVYIGVSVYSEAEDRGHRGGETSQNLIVESVEKGSPAEDAGIQAGDIITEVNGEKVTAYSDLTSVISKSKAGDVVTLTVTRGAETLKIEVTLGVRQQTALPAKDSN
jgi:serine protease Do